MSLLANVKPGKLMAASLMINVVRGFYDASFLMLPFVSCCLILCNAGCAEEQGELDAVTEIGGQGTAGQQRRPASRAEGMHLISGCCLADVHCA
jgi:hypothetical protein